MSSNSLFAVVPPSSKKPLTITVSSNGAVTTAKPRTRLLKIPILTLSLIEPLINIIADYASDDRDLMIVIQMIIFDFEYVAPAQYDRRVIELFDLCHEIGHMEWMSLHKESGLDRWWISRDWHGPSQENLAYSYTDLSNIDWFKSVWATLKRGVWFPKLWRDIKLEWSRHNDSRFQHCSSCLHAVSPSEPSTIYGTCCAYQKTKPAENCIS